MVSHHSGLKTQVSIYYIYVLNVAVDTIKNKGCLSSENSQKRGGRAFFKTEYDEKQDIFIGIDTNPLRKPDTFIVREAYTATHKC